jgi:UDP-GlcNAc:undecaprenyl-phosphate GlcNAc-1-phosphate transferase
MTISDIVILVTCFLGSLIGTYILIPKIINVVVYKHLMDNPNERSSHSQQIPSLGGIAFYICFMLGLFLLQSFDFTSISMSLVAGMTILFMVGLKDDLVVISPVTKLGAQIAASAFIIANPNFHLQALYNAIGIGGVNVYLSIALIIFLMIYIINAFNLIDGIDGLASIVAIVIFSTYGVMFFMLERYFFLGVSLLAIGSLISFLRYNLSANKKIFMGDTGSMILGFVVAVMTVRIFSYDYATINKLPFQLENLPLIVMAVLIVPLFDTSRVFAVRILEKRRPFSADRNHIHHLLIDYLGLSHRKASILIGIVNVLFASIFLLFGVNYNNITLLVIMLLCILFFLFFFFRIDFSYKNLRRRILFKRKIDNIKKKTNLNF